MNLAVERLAFEDPAVAYHSYHAAQHVVRYAAVRDIVAGRRVLDVACGEGYGARLLLEWGAREVVGIDISPAAVAVAKRQFGGRGAAFLVGNAEAIGAVLDGADPFDLVMSIETIEHLARPDDFLAALPGLLAPGGAIVISCPNDRAYAGGSDRNPFHVRQFGFADFRSLTERHLGPASMWLLGSPLLGEINFRPGDGFAENPHDAQLSLLDARAVGNALVIPAQSNLTTNEEKCSHYIGVWGAELCPNAVISTLPVSEYQAPWQQVEHLGLQLAKHERRQAEHYEPEIARLTGENARLEAALAAMAAERDQLQADSAAARERVAEQHASLERAAAKQAALAAKIAELEGHLEHERASAERNLVEQGALTSRIRDTLEPRIKQLTDQVSTLQRENARLTRAGERLQAENGEMRLERKARRALEARLKATAAALDKLEKEKTERYEPEIARLKAHVEHSKFEKETQMLRRRVMAYADQSRRIAGSVTVLEAKIAELEHLRDSWYVPELARLSGIIEQYEKTKREWFEPQLDSRAAHIASLEGQVRDRDTLIRELEERLSAYSVKDEAVPEKSAGRIFRFKRQERRS